MATENALNESEHSQLNVRSSLDGVHVLLVEDSEDLRTLFTRIFTRCGSTVRSFESAEEALEIVGTFKPDIIISDINLPNESGIAFLRRVRMMDLVNRQYTPAVAVTAYAHLKHEI